MTIILTYLMGYNEKGNFFFFFFQQPAFLLSIDIFIELLSTPNIYSVTHGIKLHHIAPPPMIHLSAESYQYTSLICRVEERGVPLDFEPVDTSNRKVLVGLF